MVHDSLPAVSDCAISRKESVTNEMLELRGLRKTAQN